MFSFRQVSEQPLQINTAIPTVDRGVLVGLSIIGTWAISLVALLSANVSAMPIALRLAGMLWMTFLYTGLFITAHDAMHGAVSPSNIKLNNFIGSFAVLAYALFSLKKLSKTHWLHHHHPASANDPDFHDGEHPNFFAWYFHFMVSYWSWTRLAGLVVLFHAMHRLLDVSQVNLILFWMIPAIASSIQLFFFGTYLPHREPKGGYRNECRAQSANWSMFWSFISCYHFGYHQEHHEHPHLAWWQLPGMHQRYRSQKTH